MLLIFESAFDIKLLIVEKSHLSLVIGHWSLVIGHWSLEDRAVSTASTQTLTRLVQVEDGVVK